MTNILEVLRAISNPKQVLSSFLGTNPILNNLIELEKQGKTQDIEKFARNLFNDQGRNFDEEFKNFMNNVRK